MPAIRRLAPLLLLALILFAPPRANAVIATPGFPTLIFGPGQLGEQQFYCDPQNPLLCDPAGKEATRDIIVTNNTGIDWTDFHLRLVSQGDAIIFPQAPFLNPQNLLYVADGILLDLYGAIPNGTSFSLGFVLASSDPSFTGSLPPFTLYGIPSIPEPTTLALLGTGLLGFGLARRRKAA